jgi:sugar-specific transcriptional regulator TrmB
MDLLSDLVALGFTEYEGKVYLDLLKENPANGYQLSKRTGVPRSMVYESLGRLHARGAVLKSGDERATIYRPLPPEQLLERYDRKHQQLIHNLRDSLLSIYDSQTEESLWTISGQESSFSYATQMIANGKNEVYLVLDDVALDRLRDAIMAAYGRGIQVGALLTGSGDLECGQVSYHPPAESELQGLENMLVVVVDGKECLIANLTPDMVATITTNRNLVLISRQFVWMELFAQRIYERLNPAMLELLDVSDRQILQSFSTRI